MVCSDRRRGLEPAWPLANALNFSNPDNRQFQERRGFGRLLLLHRPASRIWRKIEAQHRPNPPIAITEEKMDKARRPGAARFALRWPKNRAELQRRINSDVHLAELCEAYEAACVATEYWLRSREAAAAARAEEYRALAFATEQDILETLS